MVIKTQMKYFGILINLKLLNPEREVNKANTVFSEGTDFILRQEEVELLEDSPYMYHNSL